MANETPEPSCSRPAQIFAGPVLLEAIRRTIATIETRARVYRWAVICVATAFIAPALLALAFFSWRPLPCLALIVPVVGVFLVIDGRRVLNWQGRILQMWLAEELQLAGFRQTLQSLRHLPPGTVTGMLDRLSASELVRDLDELPPAGKACVMADCITRARRHDRRTLLSAAGATLLVGSVAASAMFQSPASLLGAPVGFILVIASRPCGERTLQRPDQTTIRRE